MKQQAAPTALRVNAPPTFTMHWLIRRTSAFQRRRPDVEMRLTTAIDPLHADESGYDVAIRGEGEEVPGWSSRRFMAEWIAPVCHVDLLSKGLLRTPEDLRDHRLITYLTEPYSWAQWLAQTGFNLEGLETQRFEQMYFALQAVLDRLGIALLPLFLIMDELASGRLVLPFGTLGLRRREYHCVYRAETAHWPVITEFLNWLLEEGEETERATNALANSFGWIL